MADVDGYHWCWRLPLSDAADNADDANAQAEGAKSEPEYKSEDTMILILMLM